MKTLLITNPKVAKIILDSLNLVINLPESTSEKLDNLSLTPMLTYLYNYVQIYLYVSIEHNPR